MAALQHRWLAESVDKGVLAVPVVLVERFAVLPFGFRTVGLDVQEAPLR